MHLGYKFELLASNVDINFRFKKLYWIDMKNMVVYGAGKTNSLFTKEYKRMESKLINTWPSLHDLSLRFRMSGFWFWLGIFYLYFYRLNHVYKMSANFYCTFAPAWNSALIVFSILKVTSSFPIIPERLHAVSIKNADTNTNQKTCVVLC